MTADLGELRRRIRAAKYMDEAALVDSMIDGYPIAQVAASVERQAAKLVVAVRARPEEHTVLDTFLQEYGLHSDEGVALMCLAESLLRVPDAGTMDALIRDKIVPANWGEHLGDSPSLLVNASTWGLMLTGRVIGVDAWAGRSVGDVVGHLVARLGEPVVRAAIIRALHILGREFVLGTHIEQALARSARGSGYSYDMLGEAARTTEAAELYYHSYQEAIAAVGAAGRGGNDLRGCGVSVKLSALHPRYEYAQRDRVLDELLPRLVDLCRRAAAFDMALTIDAEEADRLELSLDLLEAIARAPALAGWQGLGMAVQAYGKRAHACLDWLAALAQSAGRRLNVRLVKGAYWDAEVKRAQEAGHDDFPVFTVKANTDVAYLVGARRLLDSLDVLRPQFATHNAHTIAAVMQMAGDERGFEFQRLHGMGDLLYRVAGETFDRFPEVRVYAPVGGHEDLLPYLVRRLLENGANSSFVNRFLDPDSPPGSVVRDPARTAAAQNGRRHPRLRRPPDLFGTGRANSCGWDLTDADAVADLEDALAPHLSAPGGSITVPDGPRRVIVRNPADHSDVLGSAVVPDAATVESMMARAAAAQPGWDRQGGVARAAIMRRAADLLGEDRVPLIALLVREAGKTVPDAIAEVREAEDFCRYYADLAESRFAAPMTLPGPTGEHNELSRHGRGTIVCISPWNFPLAIFVGQIVGALLAGNAVVAKPAEQTPLIALRALELLHRAGVPADVLGCVPGAGDAGQMLVASPHVQGVAFTGSMVVARTINQQLAQRPGAIVPLVAETGGQNAMFVDSSALLEQVVDDVLKSAFGAAGQRCSALRVLMLQEDVADRALHLVRGAMDELRIGNPADLTTDVGPVIDEDARAGLVAHIAACRRAGMQVHVARGAIPEEGTFMAPHIIELEDLSALGEEHFGPILHVVRFSSEAFDEALATIRKLGYGLTLGLHSRIDARTEAAFEESIAGNVYVNRNMVGAVVGVQPFGGTGLSGTGPKAGGPAYLDRFATERTLTVNTMAQGGNVELLRG